MKVLFDIQDMLEDELKKISKKDDITAMDLENIYKMVDIVKDVTTIDAMQKAEKEGYSYARDMSRDMSRGYSEDYANAYASYRSYDGRRGRDGDSDGRYSEDGSYRRGRDAMGRYTSRDSYDGYSGHGKEDMIDNLKEMMRNARSEEERESYRKTIEQLQR